METRRPAPRPSIWERGAWCSLLALPVGLALLAGCLCLIGGMMLLTDAAEWMLSLTAGISLCASGYGMGHFAGFRRRRKGLQTGLICGGALYGILLVIGIIWQDTAGGWLRPACILVSSCLGSVMGTNRKQGKSHM